MSDPGQARPSPFEAATVYLIACVGLCAFAFGLFAPLGTVGMTAAYYALFVMLPAGLWIRRHAPGGPALRLNPVSARRLLWIALSALLCAHAATYLEALWMGALQRIGLNVFAAEGIPVDTRRELVEGLVSAALIAPAAEELLFRGMLLSAWEGRGRRRAALATAGLFALMHVSPIAMPVQFLVGLLLAECAFASDSLYGCMIFHMIYNAAQLIGSHISARLEVDPALESKAHADILGAFGTAGSAAMLLLGIGCILLAFVVLARRVCVDATPEAPVPAKADPYAAVVLACGVLTCVLLFAVSTVNMLGGWG